jgi:beta-glucanase (GH16 family)
MLKSIKVLAITLAMTAAILNADDFQLDGTWKLHHWKGYKPDPVMTCENSVLSIREVRGEYGFAVASSIRPAAKAGDTVTFHARLKGKGVFFLKLHNLDAEGKWICESSRSVRHELTQDWDDVALSVGVDNTEGKRPTRRILITVGTGNGGELDMTDSRLILQATDYVGEAKFPSQWLVFPNVANDAEPPLKTIPEEIDGIKGVLLTPENGQLDLTSLFPTQKLRNCAWLYGKIKATCASPYTLGAGADYFMALHVNGKCVIDTLKSGDGSDFPHFSNHIVQVELEEGDNVVAVKFESGTGKTPGISIGGAEDLRNLSSRIKIVEKFDSDDYEQDTPRPGNPQRVKRIFTEGMDNLVTVAIYAPGTRLEFPEKTYDLPGKTSNKYFASGLRLYQFDGAGSLDFCLGQELVLSVWRQTDQGDLKMTVKQRGVTLKSSVLPLASLPADLIFAVSASEYLVNAGSIHDSRLFAFSGKADCTNLKSFAATVAVNGVSVTVDEYFNGLASREVKSHSIPMKIDLAATFDPEQAGWPLIFQDEFDGTEVDWKNKWTSQPWSRETNANNDLAVLKDGKLHVTCEWNADDNGKVKGRAKNLYSRERFSYGYFEAKVRFTRKPGCWAAFWLYDEVRNMQLGGGYEIDIFEDYSTRGGKPVVASNLHATRGSHQDSYGYHMNLPGSLDDFYVIGCKWTPFEISTYINGQLVEANSRHSPWQSLTYDAINHGFGTSTLYLCIGVCVGQSGGRGVIGTKEEFIVDWVRVYEYPRQTAPVVTWSKLPQKSLVAEGEIFSLGAVSSKPGTAYLFDNGRLVDYKTSPPYDFQLAIDWKHYKDTQWHQAGRSGAQMNLDRYPHIYRIVVQDSSGQVGYTDVFPMISDLQPGQPWQDRMPAIPGKIDPTAFNTGGHNVSCFKQSWTPHPIGKELFSRKKLGLREAGEFVTYTLDVKQSGTYRLTMPRRPYPEDLRWPSKALVIIDGKYVGDLKAEAFEQTAVLDDVKITEGIRSMVLISACAYGVWPDALEFQVK